MPIENSPAHPPPRRASRRKSTFRSVCYMFSSSNHGRNAPAMSMPPRQPQRVLPFAVRRVASSLKNTMPARSGRPTCGRIICTLIAFLAQWWDPRTAFYRNQSAGGAPHAPLTAGNRSCVSRPITPPAFTILFRMHLPRPAWVTIAPRAIASARRPSPNNGMPAGVHAIIVPPPSPCRPRSERSPCTSHHAIMSPGR